MDRKPKYYPEFWMAVYILFIILGAVAGCAETYDCDRVYKEIVTDMDAYTWELQCNNLEEAE